MTYMSWGVMAPLQVRERRQTDRARRTGSPPSETQLLHAWVCSSKSRIKYIHQKDRQKNVHDCLNNSPNLKAIQMPFRRRRDTQIVIVVHTL
jgi:hypothetical protein